MQRFFCLKINSRSVRIDLVHGNKFDLGVLPGVGVVGLVFISNDQIVVAVVEDGGDVKGQVGALVGLHESETRPIGSSGLTARLSTNHLGRLKTKSKKRERFVICTTLLVLFHLPLDDAARKTKQKKKPCPVPDRNLKISPPSSDLF